MPRSASGPVTDFFVESQKMKFRSIESSVPAGLVTHFQLHRGLHALGVAEHDDANFFSRPVRAELVGEVIEVLDGRAGKFHQDVAPLEPGFGSGAGVADVGKSYAFDLGTHVRDGPEIGAVAAPAAGCAHGARLHNTGKL